MKKQFFRMTTALALLTLPLFYSAQSINLNSAAGFVLFSTDGPLSNTGTSAITGDVGTNNGTSSGFATLIGTVHDMDGASALCASDLLSAYNQLNSTTATLIPVTTLGNGQVLVAGSYSISAASTLNNTLTLDGQANPNAVFIIQIKGAFSTAAGATVLLTNGASACNVYWTVEGVISLAAGTNMKGTMIANNAAINMSSGVILEGRALSTSGAVGVDGITAHLPTGCGTVAATSPVIVKQPVSYTVCAGNLVKFSVSAYGSALTYQWRKGTVNLVNGGNISGATSAVLTINPAGAADLASDYNVYISGSTAPAVTSGHATLTLGQSPTIISEPSAQIGCVDYAVHFLVMASGSGLSYQWMKGNLALVNGGNISGANGPMLTIDPMVISDTASNYHVIVTGLCTPAKTSVNARLSSCGGVGISDHSGKGSKILSFYPNPFGASLHIICKDAAEAVNELIILNVLGAEVTRVAITKNVTNLETNNFPQGVYFYKVIANHKTVQSGKLIAQ